MNLKTILTVVMSMAFINLAMPSHSFADIERGSAHTGSSGCTTIQNSSGGGLVIVPIKDRNGNVVGQMYFFVDTARDMVDVLNMHCNSAEETSQ